MTINKEVESTFGNIPGYSHWVRKDLENRTGGVATCFKDGLQTQELEVVLLHLTEAFFFKLVLADSSGLLLWKKECRQDALCGKNVLSHEGDLKGRRHPLFTSFTLAFPYFTD